MTEKCKAHPEQELVIIKFCPCCHQEFYGKHRNVSMGVAVEPLPQGALPIYDSEHVVAEDLDIEFETTADILREEGDDSA